MLLQGAAVKVRCPLSPLQGATVRVLLSECGVCFGVRSLVLCRVLLQGWWCCRVLWVVFVFFASLPLSQNMQVLPTNTVCHFRVYAGTITFL